MARTNPREKDKPGPTEDHPDIVIKGGTLLSMAEGESPVDRARVFIKGDRIVDIKTSDGAERYPEGTEVIDAENSVIMPGLINAHSHTAMTIFRGYADDLPLKQWLFDKIFPAEAEHLNHETVYWGTLLGCLEMIASGTTGLVDGYFFPEDTVRAVHKSGLRALIAQGVIDFPAPGVSDPEENLITGWKFLERWRGFSDLITPGLFCHSPVTCSDKTLKTSMEISNDLSLPLQIHLSETSEEVEEIVKRTGQRPVHYLNGLGLLNDGLIAAHSIHLDDEEMELLAGNDVRIVHVPESNMKLSSGVARVSEMVKMGLTVGIGTDGCASNNNLDLFQEMDTAAKLGKVFTVDPVDMDARTVLRMATSRGAKIMGLEKETGSIEKGKKADIIVVDMDRPHLVPLYDPISTLVYSASGADVKDVIVNGRILMKDRIFLTLDQEEIMERVRAISRDIGS
ncbi:MAG: amidohydrolase [Deltaproteobacteria bacterium]|nr:amidohydrolase [Deltaproteobacteria bacterium]